MFYSRYSSRTLVSRAITRYEKRIKMKKKKELKCFLFFTNDEV